MKCDTRAVRPLPAPLVRKMPAVLIAQLFGIDSVAPKRSAAEVVNRQKKLAGRVETATLRASPSVWSSMEKSPAAEQLHVTALFGATNAALWHGTELDCESAWFATRRLRVRSRSSPLNIKRTFEFRHLFVL